MGVFLNRLFRSITALYCGREKYVHLILIALFAFLCLKPMLNSGYYGDDAINSLNPACLKYENKSMLSSNYGLFLQWVNSQGRFYPMAYYGDMVYSIFTTPYSYKFSIMVLVAADLALFYLLLVEFGFSGLFSLAASISVAAFIQFRIFHDPVLQFHWMMQLVFGYFIVSLLLFIKGLKNGRGIYFFFSVLFYLLSMLTYEIAYLFFPFYFLAAFYYAGNRKEAVKKSLPFIIASCALIAIAFILRSYPSGIDQRYLVNRDAGAYFVTLGRQLIAGLPLSYYYVDPNRIFTRHIIEYFGNAKHSDLFAAAVLGIAILIYMSAGREKENGYFLPVFGSLLFVLPALLIASSVKIQKDIGPGFGYIPVYLQQFGFMAVLFALFELVKRKLNSNWIVAALVACVMAAVLLINLHNNRTVVETFNAGMKYPREVLGNYLKETGASDLDGKGIIIVDGGAPWENKYFFYQQTGRKYNVLTENEFKALPSADYRREAIVIKYWYCGNKKGIVNLYGFSGAGGSGAAKKLIKHVQVEL